MPGPTLKLLLCDERHNTLAGIEDLPMPHHYNPDGYITFDDLGPCMRHALDAFAQAWEEYCGTQA